VRHIVEGELGDRLPTIDINEWTNTLGDLQRLTVKVDRLLGSGRALMMPQKLESDCAYEILTNEEQSLAEQDSLLLSFLMTTKPPEERREQVRDSQPSDS
jgi:hypothetical protein